MAATIRSIRIENFRSIRALTADVSKACVFVGKNDCGKSNILRALNLFFNGQTNPGTYFSFEEDYNFFAPDRARRAKEIRVQVEINLPNSYHETNGQFIVWTKKWREDGLWSEEYDYYGVRLTQNRRGKEVREEVRIPDKSNVHSLLRKIDFEYVPAVKDSDYFDDLRGRIYGIISDAAARTFHDSSAAFEQSIGDHLNVLTTSITESLGFGTRLALPRDLYHIFERLDFLSGEKNISLNNRGDGIKARHIPLILKFMAEKKAELQRRGGPPISSIWAYEEPENNLEIASAIQLADELLALARVGTAQILMTTHSPAFYDLGQREADVLLNYITRLNDLDGTISKKDTSGIDESLGTLALLAPRVSEMVAEVRIYEAAKLEAKQLDEANRPCIFVEGESDMLVLSKALELFFPAAVGRVQFVTKREGGGHNYVIDLLVGWRSQHKHHPDRPKAAGIVDSDADEARKAFNNAPANTQSAKCFVYPKPEILRNAHRARFKIPATLETLYPLELWRNARARGALQARDLLKVYPTELAQRILAGNAEPREGLNEDWAILAEYDFAPERKIPTARWICQRPENECRILLANYEQVLRDTMDFLGVI